MPATLDRLAARHPEIGGAVAALRAILEAMRECTRPLPAGMPDLELARTRLGAGLPALSGQPLMAGETLLANADRLADRLSAVGLVEPSRIAAALRRSRQALDVDAIAVLALDGEWDMLPPLARTLDLDEQVLLTVLDHAVRPALRAAAAVVAEPIADAHWHRGICPACGAPPVLAELRGSGQSHTEEPRVLRCGRCASAWSVERLRCHRCGERDHGRLGYVHVEGEEEFRRIERCDSCRGYVKAISVLAPLDADALLEEDLATAGLDLIAAERGYRR